MPFSIDELVTPLSRAEIQASFYAVYGKLGMRVSSWKPGAVVRTWTWASAVVLSAFSDLAASIAKSGYLEYAEGTWLDLLAWYVYRQTRDQASFATGTVRLTNHGGGEYELDPGDLIVSSPTTNKQYRNTSPVTIAAGAANIIVPIRAVEAGAASSASAGEITDMVTTLLQVECLGNDTSVSGTDAESNAALRTKCLESLGALSPFGPWDAYASAVRAARRDDGSSLGVTRIRPSNDGYGNVTVYVATASGGIQPGDVDVANAAVRARAEPLSVNAEVVSATAVLTPITYELWIYNTTGRTDDEIKAVIAARLSAFVQRQPIGGNKIDSTSRVYKTAIAAEIGSVFPQVIRVDVTAPSGDVALTPSQVMTLGEVTGTIHQVPAGEGLA